DAKRLQHQLEVDHALYSQPHYRPPLLVYPSPLPEDGIGPEELVILRDVIIQVHAPHLLFPLEAELHVAGRLSVHLQVALKMLQPRHQLSLVIGDPSPVQSPLPELRLEGWRLLAVERLLGWLLLMVVYDKSISRVATI